jgi:hypothetical protein
MSLRSRIITNSACTLIAVLALSVSAIATDVPDLTVDQILDRYVEAVGGEEAINKITSRQCMGKVTTDLTARDNPAYESALFRISTKTTGKYLFEELVDGPSARSGSDGTIHWHSDQCGISRKDDGNLKLEFLTDPHGPIRVHDYFGELTHKGTFEVNGRTTYRLEPANLKPEYYSLYFDVETGMLLAIGYHWYVEDYREVDGVLFPFKIAAGRKGGSTVYEFERVENNVPLDDEIFAVPSR